MKTFKNNLRIRNSHGQDQFDNVYRERPVIFERKALTSH